jgi:ABC-type uncharacterized transport system YnjBCD ATPase subunit
LPDDPANLKGNAMKKIAISALLLISLALAACEPQPERLPGGDEPAAFDDKCPRADGEPCR